MFSCLNRNKIMYSEENKKSFELFMNSEKEKVYQNLSEKKNFLLLEEKKFKKYNSLKKSLRKQLQGFKDYDNYVIVISDSTYFIYPIAKACLKFRIS